VLVLSGSVVAVVDMVVIRYREDTAMVNSNNREMMNIVGW
jgi:hypothetical protein